MKILGGKGALITAIGLGLLTSVLVGNVVSEAGKKAGRQVETAPVVVAASAIPARTIITPDMVRVKQVPVEARHPEAVASPNGVVGTITRTTITADEQVLQSRLFLQRAESGLAFMVPDGMRAVSVGFSEVIGSGGLVLPNDHVDVIGVFEVKMPMPTPVPGPLMRDGDDKAHIATMVLEDVEVLAIAQQVEGEDTRDTQTRLIQGAGANGGGASQQQVRSQPPAQPQAKTVTFAVNPEDALRLVLAEERGKIRLALRHAKDNSTTGVAQLPNPLFQNVAR